MTSIPTARKLGNNSLIFSYILVLVGGIIRLEHVESKSCLAKAPWSDANCFLGPVSVRTDIAPKAFHQLCPQRRSKFEAPTSCDLYITCHDESLTVNRCPAGTHFHPIGKTCVDSHLFECSYPVIKDPSILLKDKADKNSRVTRNLHWSYGNSDPFTFHRLSRNLKYDYCQDGEEGIFPHPESCQHFIQCGSGKLFEQECPSGTFFNARRSVCDWPSKVNCNQRFKRSANQITTGELHRTKRNKREACPRDFIGPHPKFCNQFQVCSHGRLFSQTCVEGTLFDPLKKVCAHTPTVDCGARIRDFQTYDCQPGFKYRTLHPEDCHKFIECENEQIHVKTCPGKTIFNPEKSFCDHSRKTVCKSPISLEHDTDINYRGQLGNRLTRDLSKYVCEFNYIAPLDGTCNRFIECENKRLFQKSCGPGTAYNPLLGQCDWPYNVRTPDQQYCSRYLQCDGKQFVPKECPKNNYYNADNGKCEGIDKVNCAGKDDDPKRDTGYLQSK